MKKMQFLYINLPVYYERYKGLSATFMCINLTTVLIYISQSLRLSGDVPLSLFSEAIAITNQY